MAAVNANTGQLIGQTGVLAPEVVSAPLIFETGEVVVGTSDGHVYIVRGLQEGSPWFVNRYIGGRVTALPVKISDGSEKSFVISDDGNNGYVSAFYINDGVHGDFDPAWERVVQSGSVPASFARDDQENGKTYVYFSNKYGRFFKVDLLTGSSSINTVFDNSYRTFINNSPAVGNSFIHNETLTGKPGLNFWGDYLVWKTWLLFARSRIAETESL